ncbi:MAG TPA: iron-containing alcohol dehydrogenase [Syntrophales bacterium]|nr:iron-containing alcohol dehydrogenase [Syntrophales bacterium]
MDVPGYYEFCSRVRIISGHNALEKIPEALTRLTAVKPMIVTDKGVVGAGLIDAVLGAIGNSVSVGALAEDVPPDSDLRVVNNLAKTYLERGCDSIIAVGGGSVMDTAKGINIVVSERACDLMEFSGANSLKRPLRPLIAIPTTAGTGSEVTAVAVIKDHDKHLKMLFVSNFLLPDVSVVDSRMTSTLPPAVTAATGMDALSHAVEAYTCLAKNPLSDAHAMAAIRLISDNLLKVTRNPGEMDGRLSMANAATLAGIAFGNSMVGMVHTIGHSVGSICGVPHGVCMAILLPYGLLYNRHKNGHLTAELLFSLAGPDVYANTPRERRTDEVIERIRKMNHDLRDATNGRHPRFFKEVLDREGRQMVPKEKLQGIAKTALSDGSIFYNPEDLDYGDFLTVLEAAWDGEPLPGNLK